MKTLILLSLLLCLPIFSYADMTIVENVKTGAIMGQPAQNGTTTIYIKGKKMRIEQSTTANYQIMDLQANKMYIVDSGKKEVMVMSSEMMSQAGGMLSSLGQNMKFSVKKTGNEKTINGWACEEYTVSASGPFSMNMSQWVTTDVDTAEFDGFKAFADSFMRMFGQQDNSLPKGMPIRSEGKMNMMGQNVDTMTEVQTISRDSVDEAKFVVPADYKVKDMQGMMKQN